MTALAAMQDTLLSPYESIQCTPVRGVRPRRAPRSRTGTRTRTGDDAAEALAQSCDTYFYDVGNRYYTRGEHERGTGRGCRTGRGSSASAQQPGLDIGGEDAGAAADAGLAQEDVQDRLDRAWNPGDSIQLAIGQKDITVTPLQMARFYAVIANGGKLVTPYSSPRSSSPASDGVAAGDAAARSRRAAAAGRTSTRRAHAVVRDGLYAATHCGYGTSSGVFGSFPVPIAGKTGTAEKVVQLPGYPAGHLEDQAWWCGWGPFDGTSTYAGSGADRRLRGDRERRPRRRRRRRRRRCAVFEQWFGEKRRRPGAWSRRD